jgi:hypothetical protein
MLENIEWLRWAPLAFASLHIFEEFVWPGGFMRWYRVYRGNTKSVNRTFLVIINAGLLITLFEAAIAARTSAGVALLLTFSGVLFSNGCWHVWASYKGHAYSPGTITGVLLFLPLAFYECAGWIRLSRTSFWTTIVALSIGATYPLWSAMYHGRPQKQTAASE